MNYSMTQCLTNNETIVAQSTHEMVAGMVDHTFEMFLLSLIEERQIGAELTVDCSDETTDAKNAAIDYGVKLQNLSRAVKEIL